MTLAASRLLQSNGNSCTTTVNSNTSSSCSSSECMQCKHCSCTSKQLFCLHCCSDLVMSLATPLQRNECMYAGGCCDVFLRVPLHSVDFNVFALTALRKHEVSCKLLVSNNTSDTRETHADVQVDRIAHMVPSKEHSNKITYAFHSVVIWYKTTTSTARTTHSYTLVSPAT